MIAYYNEVDPYAAAWLRELIAARFIPAGDVDERSIADVQPDDLRGYTQCHFFAGLGGWPYAARLAGWPDERPLWTGSCPCQPFSVAGKGRGVHDERDLWPEFFRLIRACRPPVVMGEQVAGQAGYGWFDGVRADLEGEDYASRGVDIPACAVDAPHIRSRIYWLSVADAAGRGCGETARPQTEGGGGGPDRAKPRSSRQLAQGPERCSALGHASPPGLSLSEREAIPGSGRGRERREPGEPSRALGHDGTFWSDHIWLTGADGKSRRAEPGIRLMAHGLPKRVPQLRALGNAIVPQLAAEVIAAFMETA